MDFTHCTNEMITAKSHPNAVITRPASADNPIVAYDDGFKNCPEYEPEFGKVNAAKAPHTDTMVPRRVDTRPTMNNVAIDRTACVVLF